MTTAIAFSNASLVMICRAVIPRRISSTTALPDSTADSSRRRSGAGGDAEPGSAIPIASETAAIVLAVNIPPQAPSPGHALRSIASRSARVMAPTAQAPTPSKASCRVMSLPPSRPGRIEPA